MERYKAVVFFTFVERFCIEKWPFGAIVESKSIAFPDLGYFCFLETFPNKNSSIMNRIVTLFLMFFLSFQLAAEPSKYARLKILMEGRELNELGETGIALQGLEYRPGLYVIGEYSQEEQKLLAEAGFLFEVLIDDMAEYYVGRNAGFDKTTVEASWRVSDPGKRNQTPQNFSLGSMGGFYTYAELLATLDNMHMQFPDLISAKAAIGETTSIQGRPVYWLRISNNPDVEQDKPKVLYTALTHAREPLSMQQMIYQMWYLLENYGTEPEITYLIDNLEMYFVPCVNPDGYIYNQQINPNGGGMHRKNMRVNADYSTGVDLNRNFGYMWGYDNSGSSPTPSSNTFRGTGPFSEPETQLLKQFAETYDFSLALNNHTYSDLLIYPWGYQNQLTPDGEVFSAFASLLTRENNYTYGTCYETLNYFANGGSDDWFYGEQQTKNKVFAFTPEAGSPSDGFWPAMNRIETICAGHTGMNLYLARLALAYAEMEALGSRNVVSHEFYFPFRLKSYGLDTPASFTLSVNPISPLITGMGNPIVFENMELLQSELDSVMITLHPATYNGLMFDFEVLIDNGAFAWRDTVKLLFGEPLFADQFGTAENWTGNTWGLDGTHYVSAPYSMADSPGGNYANNASTLLNLNQTIDLTNHESAFVEFDARWDIERNYDYAQFLVSQDGGNTWVPMPGKFTASGSNNQTPGLPLYHGTQTSWVKEKISLDDYAGKQINLRFRFFSDGSVTRDGFYFDDFHVFAFRDFQPIPPVITGQESVAILMAEPFSMEMDWLFVEDNFVNYPLGHSLWVLPGENYVLDGETIYPDPEFYGMLEVMVKVSNGLFESEVYTFEVEVFNTLRVVEPIAMQARVYYDNNSKALVIFGEEAFEAQNYLLSVFDIYGRQMLRQEIFLNGSKCYVPLQLHSGIYVFDLRGKKAFSGKFPVF
jgi:carboxypeptidase T